MKRNTTLATLLLLAALPLAAGAADAAAPVPAEKMPPPAPAGDAAKGETPPLFKELDGNKDGYVTKDEAKRSAEVTARFAELDADRDGKVAAAEFRKGMMPGK